MCTEVSDENLTVSYLNFNSDLTTREMQFTPETEARIKRLGQVCIFSHLHFCICKAMTYITTQYDIAKYLTVKGFKTVQWSIHM